MLLEPSRRTASASLDEPRKAGAARPTQDLSPAEPAHRIVTENSADILVWVRDGVITWVSPALEWNIGWSPAEWIGETYRSFVHPEDRHSVSDCQGAGEAAGCTARRFRVIGTDGAYHWVEGHARLLTAEEDAEGIVDTLRVIDDLVRDEEELEQRARHDGLTGLLNRQEMLERIEALGHHPRREGSRMAILFCDVDHLKPVNDTLGHPAGDELLMAVAQRIRDCLRSGDAAARVGGDEFLVLLSGLRSLDDAMAVAEKIRTCVSDPLDVNGHPILPSISIGVSMVRAGVSTDRLIAEADQAMYEAKRANGNRVLHAVVTTANTNGNGTPPLTPQQPSPATAGTTEGEAP